MVSGSSPVLFNVLTTPCPAYSKLESSMSHPAATILPHPELASALSDGDAAALSKLSNAAQVRAWTRRMVAMHEEYISTLLAIHNSLAPINDLPPEILRMVLADVPSEEASWCDPVWMLSLQSVCRRWRSVLLATPEYWAQGIERVMDLFRDGSFLVSDKDEDVRVNVLHLFLARSAPCPLEVNMAYPSRVGYRPGWRVFNNHFDRVTVFEVTAGGKAELRDDILPTVATKMKRLEMFRLDTMDFNISTKSLDQWEPQNLPCLGYLTISGHLFCRAMTLPSLHTVDLIDRRYIESLPTLLPALEACPALKTLSLHLATNRRRRRGNKEQTPDRIASLPNLCYLDVMGTTSEIYRFLSFLSFPSHTHVDLTVTNVHRGEGPLFVLLNTLPRSHSDLYTSSSIDRLYLHSGTHGWGYSGTRWVSVRCYVRGNERLELTPALPLEYAGADDLLRFMDAFSPCTLTELALDLRYPLNDMRSCSFWARFFALLPDLRRLELLSPTLDPKEERSPRAMNRFIAREFLEASKVRQGTSLAWVLRAFKWCPSHLEEELCYIERVVSGRARDGARLERLELYIMAADEHDYHWKYGVVPVDVTQITTDGMASQLATRAYVSRLEKVVDVVFISGGWGFAQDDKGDLDTGENEDACVESGLDGLEERLR